jgi:hypothetical protein
MPIPLDTADKPRYVGGAVERYLVASMLECECKVY